MRKLSLLTFLALLFFNACEFGTGLDDNPTKTSATTKAFGLTNGSYWVYQYYMLNKDKKLTYDNVFDSTYIEKDTLIKGDTFKIVINYGFRETRNNQVYRNRAILRDSAGFVIDERSNRYFWGYNYRDTLRRDTIRDFNNGGKIIAVKAYNFTSKDTSIVTPAKTFGKCSNLKATFYFYPPYNEEYKVRYGETFYSAEFGKVKEEYFGDYKDPNLYGRVLVRFKVQ